MEFHVSRAVRQKTDVDDLFFAFTGNVVFGDLRACRAFAERFNAARAERGQGGEPLHAGALFAMGLIDELNHALVARYRETQDPQLLTAALRWLEAAENKTAVEALLLRFVDQFPSVAVYRGRISPAAWLKGVTPAEKAGGAVEMPHREAAVEELLMLWLANTNPAFAPFREIFDDRPLARETIYRRATTELPRFLETRPPVSPEKGSLLDVLQAPMLASPDSLSGQLAFMRENWSEHLGPEFGETLRRTLLAADVLQEEAVAIWMAFHPNQARGGGDGGKWQAEGFVGDEFVGFGQGAAAGSQGGHGYAPEQPLPLNEYEAFSQDQSWMPTVVLIAKSTYVWLEQLSKKYLRHIYRLDQIPAEELALLASNGINGLWLIGLWERSTASQTIKRLRGQADAVASAYSLKDYRIADDLGGSYAYEQLRDLAARHGIRLASDMVPNHMGIDSTWVMEHPEWFLSRSDSPYPVYSFHGPDLSTESRFEIKIEDHYYDQTDAAVVFQLRERSNGETRFVYHGNDGTTFAWNDTAQLDYSKAAVREHVIQTILSVARQFPIIRFDAAMTLAKKHVQRLWFPLPGIGGAIPSRAESAISQAEFDALMPEEFWREVVDRVAAEVPGTLLLAEAFWLLEGYFVRTLGMHRVYNSAFMNMLRDEENAKYRSYLKKTIEFDPDILKRYVNFMSNPDERTAVDQFGSGDKYFGACTLLSTLPGLPMFGHGQIEAFTEKYGMEYKQARLVEWPNEDLVARHQREIAPLLKNRQLFAESHNFVLYDLWRGAADVDESVFVYSNRVDHADWIERALVFYNNSYSSTHGTIHLSAAAMDKGSGELRQRWLAEALRLPAQSDRYLAWRDTASGLEYLQRASDFENSGFTVSLRGYQYAVLLDWRELVATEEHPWDRLAAALNGAGVYNLDEALSMLRLRPLHEALRAALSPDVLGCFAAVTQRRELKGNEVGLASDPSSPEAAPDEKSVRVDGNVAVTFGEVLGGSSEEAIVGASDAASSHAVDEPSHQAVEHPLTLFFDRAAHVAEALAAVKRSDRVIGIADRGVPVETAAIGQVESTGPSADKTIAGGVLSDGVGPHHDEDVAVSSSGAIDFEQTTDRLARLPGLEVEFSRPWPRTAWAILPTAGNTVAWPPSVAWLLIDEVLSAASWTNDGTTEEVSGKVNEAVNRERSSVVEAFDQLHLRSALAEIFRSLGVEGEDAWRAAARVRILLAYGRGDDSRGNSPTLIEALLASERFWTDPDVRWMTALNEVDGKTYVNQECLEEMVWWLQVPALVRAVSDAEQIASDQRTDGHTDRPTNGRVGTPRSAASSAVRQIEEHILRCESAARGAGFELGTLKQLLQADAASEPVEPTVPSSVASTSC